MVHPEKKHFIIVGRTLGVQVLLFIGILLAVWGAQKLYTAIGRSAHQLGNTR